MKIWIELYTKEMFAHHVCRLIAQPNLMLDSEFFLGRIHRILNEGAHNFIRTAVPSPKPAHDNCTSHLNCTIKIGTVVYVNIVLCHV